MGKIPVLALAQLLQIQMKNRLKEFGDCVKTRIVTEGNSPNWYENNYWVEVVAELKDENRTMRLRIDPVDGKVTVLE